MRMPALVSTASTVPAVLAAETATAQAFLRERHAPATRRAYVSDARIFAAWCAARGLEALPAAPETVVLFVSSEAQAGSRYATISRRVAAIRYAHQAAGHESPTGRDLVNAALSGIRRTLGVAPVRKAPATAPRVEAMVRECPDTLRGLRDRALLLLGFAGAFRRSELVALEVEDLEETPEGLRVRVRRSKTDQDGAGQFVPVLNGSRLRVVEALKAWREAAGITSGPLFRPLAKGGRVLAQPLSTKSVADIVKAYAEQAGFDASAFAGHSLRAGFLTSAAESGASIFSMMAVSRHRSLETVRGYVRTAELFKNHAGAAFL
jgi:site-specific recombinase XerD